MAPLPLIVRMAEDLGRAGVAYCQWKSNGRLASAVAGETDLDLLIGEGEAATFEKVVMELGFRPVLTARPRRAPGVVDFVGFDAQTGRLAHLHVHHRLVLGEQRVKNHHLPVEAWLLESARPADAGIPVPRPERELVVLIVRLLLKSGARQVLIPQLRGRPSPILAAGASEARWLHGLTADGEVIDALRSSRLPIEDRLVVDFLRQAAADRLSPLWVLRRRRSVLRALRPYRRYRAVHAIRRRVWLAVRLASPVTRLWPVPRKRVVGGGTYVAVVGADGAGKTTLVEELVRWLRWKLDAHTVYFGQPKGRGPYRGLRHAASEARAIRPPRDVLYGVAELLEGAAWVYLAGRRLALDRFARRLRDRGTLVVADRFPLRELWTMPDAMDGPRIDGSSPHPLLRLLARLERSIYRRIGMPDRVILLTAPYEALSLRTQGTPPSVHRQKAQAVEAAARTGLYEVLDAVRPQPDVVLSAKSRVWTSLP